MFKYLKHTSIFHTCYASGWYNEATATFQGTILPRFCPVQPGPGSVQPEDHRCPTFSIGLCVVLGVIV